MADSREALEPGWKDSLFFPALDLGYKYVAAGHHDTYVKRIKCDPLTGNFNAVGFGIYQLTSTGILELDQIWVRHLDYSSSFPGISLSSYFWHFLWSGTWAVWHFFRQLAPGR